MEPHFLILFKDAAFSSGLTGGAKSITNPALWDLPQNAENIQVQRLENELAQLREDMRSITEDQEAVNEELQSANERTSFR